MGRERNCNLRDISEGQIGGEGDEIHFGREGVRGLQWELGGSRGDESQLGSGVRPGCTERSERSLWTEVRGPEDWPSEGAEEPRSLRQKIQKEHDTSGEGTAGSGTAINHCRWCVRTASAEGCRQETQC